MTIWTRIRDALPGSGSRVVGYVPAAPDGETVQDRALRLPDMGVRVPGMGSSGDMGMAAATLQRGQEGPRKGSYEILKMYRDSPWLRSVSHLVSAGVASVPWHLYAAPDTKAKGRFMDARRDIVQAEPMKRHRLNRKALADGELVEIQRHPWCWLMDHPNVLMRGKVARQTTVASYDMIGESAWVLGRSQDGIVRRAWPIPGTWITARPTMDDPTFKISIGGGGSGGGAGGVQWAVPWEDILLFVDPDPGNPYGRGTGIGLSLSDEIDIDEHAARTVNAWFQNKAMPDAIITMEGAARPVLERAKKDWNNLVQGFAKSWKTHFVNTKLHVERMDTNFKDQALVEIRRAQRDTIQQVWRVPPEKMGILTNSNRSTSQSADWIDAKDVKLPRLETMRDEFQRLAEMYDPRLVVEYDNPVPADAETRKAVIMAMPAYFTVNEVRELAEEDPLSCPVGDGHLVDQEGVKVWVGSLLEAKPLIRADHISSGIPTLNEVRQRLRLNHRSDGDELTGSSGGGGPFGGGSLGPMSPVPQLPPHEEDGEDPGEVLDGDSDELPSEDEPKEVSPPEKAMAARSAPSPGTVTQEEIRSIVRAARSSALVETMGPVVVRLIRTWGQGVLDDLPKDQIDVGDFDDQSPRVRARLREFAIERVQARINITTREVLDKAIREATQAFHHAPTRAPGDGLPPMDSLAAALRQAIATTFDQARADRAEVIAATEVTGQSQWATVEALRQTGIVQKKEWLATMDGRARDSHEALDGQRQEIDAPFVIPDGQLDAGSKSDAPGGFNIPRQDINCRCAVGTVIDPLGDDEDDERAAALLARGVRMVNLSPDHEARAMAWRKMDEALQPWDKRMASACREAFDIQEQAVLAALADALET